MMEYITPNIEIIQLLGHDVIRTSLQVGKETDEDSGSADDMGF